MTILKNDVIKEVVVDCENYLENLNQNNLLNATDEIFKMFAPEQGYGFEYYRDLCQLIATDMALKKRKQSILFRKR